MNAHIEMPGEVKDIIGTLKKSGYEAYAVGGCVRDSILGRTPGDWDITTSAMPEETKALFDRTFDTGIEHGTVTVLKGKTGYEVTTYRVDGEYEDSRHPREVSFTRSLREDLRRRDFTINAMAYNEEEGLVDIFGGLEDLRKGSIRCVGDARERFSEDALRILRGIRFAAQLGFELDKDTREGMGALAGTLANISAERIQAEMVKILISDRPDFLREAWRLGITKIFLPEFDLLMETEQETPHHMYNVGEHTLRAMRNIRADRVLRLTMLFHDMGKPALKTVDEDGIAHFKRHASKSEEITKAVMRRLKFDNDTIRKTAKLVSCHDLRMPISPANVRRAMSSIGRELFPMYLEVRQADVLAQSTYMREEKLEDIRKVEMIYNEVLRLGQCTSVKELAVNGRDLIVAGIRPGRVMGEILDQLLAEVLENPEMNVKDRLLERARKIYGET